MKPTLLDITETFLNSQKIDTTVMRFADDAGVIIADEDFSLVNTYVILERPFQPDELAPVLQFLERKKLDAARTELLIPDKVAGDSRQLTATVRGHVRRPVGISSFLDEHLRPRSICADLTTERDDDSTGESALLSERDFVDQWADIENLGRVSAIKHLFNGWAKGNSPRLCFALAPAGHGKSKVTHILAKRLASYYQQFLEAPTGDAPPPLPILIAFGKYRRISFTSLVLEALNRFGSVRLTMEAFQYLVSLGRVLFILDGYDEMMETSPDTGRDNVAEFIRQSGPDSRILLTSRSVFYRTATDVVGQVGDPLLSETDIQIMELQPFDRAQARRYLALRLGALGSHDRSMERAQSILEGEDALTILVRQPGFVM